MRSLQATTIVAMVALTLAADSTATSATSETTVTGSPVVVNLFLDNGIAGLGDYAASVVAACADETVYAIKCTSGPFHVKSSTCGEFAPAFTITENASVFKGSFVTQIVAHDMIVSSSLVKSCDLQGTTAAMCHITKYAWVGTKTSSFSISGTRTGVEYHRAQVTLTAGAEKMAAATKAYEKFAAPSTSATRTGIEYHQAQVILMAGAEKRAAATGAYVQSAAPSTAELTAAGVIVAVVAICLAAILAF